MNRPALAVLAVAFAIAHLPFITSSLEDIDSVNFALGVRDFEVADHRPHPPGYPVYIALGKAGVTVARAFSRDVAASTVEARVLSVLSLLGAVAAIFLLHRVMAVWATSPDDTDLLSAPWRKFVPTTLAATALVAACPLFWYLAVRPMSDMPGLAAALAAQACLLLAFWRQQPDASGDRRLNAERLGASGSMLVLGALLSGLAIGFRSQNAVLTVPLLVGALFDRIGRGVAGAMLGVAVAFGVGVLLWAVPLIVASGGVEAYLAALGLQAGEDFAGVEMLYLNPSPRLAALALMRTFIYPWDSVPLGTIIVLFGIVGVIGLLMQNVRALVAIALVTLPYLAFHLLFQDTDFVRYALPLVPPTAFLAVRGLTWLSGNLALVATGGLALWAVSLAGPTLAAYGSEPSPTVRAVRAMGHAAREASPAALGMHQTFRRPLEAEDVSFVTVLPAPPRREWLELVEYWRGGGTDAIWFLADPRRTDLALVDPQSRAERRDFFWRFSSLSTLGGMRPFEAHWYQMPAPGWFAEEGWALTPETAGVARLMGRGPSIAPITAWVRRRPEPTHVLIGGRHLGPPDDPPVRFILAIDDDDVADWEAGPGFFLHEIDLPAGAVAGEGLARLTIRSMSGSGGSISTAVEQFDLQSQGTLIWGYGEGWHEAEFDPALGMWRWTSERATLRVSGAAGPVIVTLRVEAPDRYFEDQPKVRMLAGGEILGETGFADGTLWSVRVPAGALQQSGGQVTIETNRTFVPAEGGSVLDRRRLGLRVFGVTVVNEH